MDLLDLLERSELGLFRLLEEDAPLLDLFELLLNEEGALSLLSLLESERVPKLVVAVETEDMETLELDRPFSARGDVMRVPVTSREDPLGIRRNEDVRPGVP